MLIIDSSSNLRFRPSHGTVHHSCGKISADNLCSTKAEQVPRQALLLVCWYMTPYFPTVLTNPAGHENMGIVEEVGEGVSLLKKGDRVVMPFNVADGRCRNCEEGKTAFCTGVNPGFAGGAYGYVAMGPYRGGYVLSD
jgi:hypothetical protein